MNIRLAVCGSTGHCRPLRKISSGMRSSRSSSWSSLPRRCASARKATRSVGGRRDHPVAGQAGADPQRDREVRLAVPADPGRTPFVQEVDLAEVLDHGQLSECLTVKSNSSSVLRAAERP